ncbi:hypothetical protein SAMN05660420_03412 [Desulfuromusa kysingii]|uniref:Glycine zipper family protein n=1 Tax=Desulfuromusa kysingii TaxID=37625 RepID=A0A1H4EKX7_9BACT|nr:DUF6515 family protein [Desulfuromusa kysingii]SEA85220.1 hypothetical protein SAMN05660420_03412 [Desulfuromusa kysingii]
MLNKRIHFYAILLIVNVFLLSSTGWAAPGHGPVGAGFQEHPGYVFDQRYHHNNYYPPRGAMVNELPRGYRVVHHRENSYYFYGGAWYRPSGPRFVVVSPPVGLMIPFLPHAYTTIWVGGIPYYYADDTYYRWAPERNVYIVSEAPPESEVIEEPAVPSKLFVYPKQGQSAQQQATDRYECHSWAKGQTGFDPTLPGGGVPAVQNASRRQDYNRAIKACLEERGYSVR